MNNRGTTPNNPPPLPDAHSRQVEWITVVILPLLGLVLLGILLLRVPLPACTFLSLTGLPCITCGMTRAGELLLQWDFVGAFLLNPLAILLPLSLAAAWLFCLGALCGIFPGTQRLTIPAKWHALLRTAIVLCLGAVWLFVIAGFFAVS